jgi:hypothetical protein
MDKLIRIIKAVSVKNISRGNLGFLTEEEENWYNVNADQKVLEELLETIQKGNTIEFEMNKGMPENFVLKEKSQEQGSFTDDLVSFEDLLNDAHIKYKDFSVRTELIENDWEKQRAIFKATIEIVEEGLNYEYQAFGDATQENCGSMVKMHYIRMAETRAIARALRWATNNAKAAEEETENGEIEDIEDMAKE